MTHRPSTDDGTHHAELESDWTCSQIANMISIAEEGVRYVYTCT